MTMMMLVITSLRLSVPAAMTGSELMCLPVAMVNNACEPLSRIANTMKATISQENAVGSGWMHFSIEVRSSWYPTIRTMAETSRLARYSTLACPYGWFLSAGIRAMRDAISVMHAASESAKSWKPSATIAMELMANPRMIFITQRTLFTMIPSVPVSFVYLARTSGSL